MSLTILIETQDDIEALWSDVFGDFRGADYTDLLGDVLLDMQTLHGQYFDAEADPIGGAWPQLKLSTIAAKGHDTILQDTGRLRASLTGSHGDAIRDVFKEGGTHGLMFGTETPYAIHHLTGTKTMPARPEVGVNQPVIDEIAGRLLDQAIKDITE